MKLLIPIIYSTDNNYAPYLGVSITSLISNCNKNNKYTIFILHTGLSEHNKERLQSLSTENVAITCRDVSDYVNDVEIISANHLTEEAVYRLLIPELFPQYDKVIYLDCDLIVLQDITLLYETELDQYVAGVAQRVITDSIVKHAEYLGIPPEAVFNSGVMIINTKSFTEHKIKEQCFELLNGETKYPLLDQDVLNITCMGKVLYLDECWNCNWQSWLYDPPITAHNELFEHIISNPKIIHYSSDKKPWAHPELKGSNHFWTYARTSIFYEEILFRNIDKHIESRISDNFKYPLPYGRIPDGSKVAIYGAGNVGQAYANQIMWTKQYVQTIWVDKNHHELKKAGLDVNPPEALLNRTFDYVLVAIENEKVANQVIDALTDVGIDKSKIVWEI